jgi:hypothetical protein
MVVMKKHREGTCVGILEVIAEVEKLAGQRNGFASVSLVIVSDKDFKSGQKLLNCRLEHAEPQGLKPDVRVVEFLNGWLNEQDFHGSNLGAPAKSRPSRHPGPSTSLRINSSRGPEALGIPGFRLPPE